jgi:hypothetical protein
MEVLLAKYLRVLLVELILSREVEYARLVASSRCEAVAGLELLAALQAALRTSPFPLT